MVKVRGICQCRNVLMELAMSAEGRHLKLVDGKAYGLIRCCFGGGAKPWSAAR